MRPRALSLLLALVGSACGGEESDGLPPPDNCVPPNRRLADRCLEPGVQDDGCPAGALGLEDGTCQPAGVPPELCGDGFVPDDAMGCEPILPSEPCPKGQMAVPGESTCRAVMPCGAGKWGDIPIDATTVYVDAAYLGLDSDGSSDKPFATISDAVAAAASDSVIAVAAGSYVEDVVIHHKKVRLWGKCPSEVELVGTGTDLAALFIREAAGGTEVRGLAVRGALLGLVVSGAEDVLIERVWVHDTLDRGINVESVLGATSITVRDSLVEETQDAGVLVAGSEATLEGLLVRRTLPWSSAQLFGRGISIELACPNGVCDAAAGAQVLVRDSLVEENHDVGVSIMGSDATLDGVVIRGTQPRASDQRQGWGIAVQLACTAAGCDPLARSTALVRSSLVEKNHDLGVLIAASDATFEGVVVRGTLPNAKDQNFGRGAKRCRRSAPAA